MRFQQLKFSAICSLLLCIGPSPGYGETYAYLSEGETGEPVFSDIPSESAQRIPLAEYNQPSVSSAEQIEQMLRVADELAIAREAREAQRADRRAAAAERLPPETIYIEERDYSYGYPYFPYPYPPVHPDPAPPERPTQSFRFEPKL